MNSSGGGILNSDIYSGYDVHTTPSEYSRYECDNTTPIVSMYYNYRTAPNPKVNLANVDLVEDGYAYMITKYYSSITVTTSNYNSNDVKNWLKGKTYIEYDDSIISNPENLVGTRVNNYYEIPNSATITAASESDMFTYYRIYASQWFNHGISIQGFSYLTKKSVSSFANNIQADAVGNIGPLTNSKIDVIEWTGTGEAGYHPITGRAPIAAILYMEEYP